MKSRCKQNWRAKQEEFSLEANFGSTKGPENRPAGRESESCQERTRRTRPSPPGRRPVNCCISASSKGQAKRELHDPRVASKGGDLARRTAAEIVAGLAELHRIGQIEYLPAELHAERFTDGEVAHQSKVQDVGVWAAKRIAADIAEEAWVLQLVGISQIGLQRPARTVLAWRCSPM